MLVKLEVIFGVMNLGTLAFSFSLVFFMFKMSHLLTLDDHKELRQAFSFRELEYSMKSMVSRRERLSSA